jgi:hypothetical protein
MKKIILIWIITIFLYIHSIYSVSAEINTNNDLKIKVEKIFSTFIQRSEKKQSKTKVLKKISALEEKITKVIDNKKLSDKSFTIYNTLLESSREYISDYEYYQQEIKKNIILWNHNISKDFSKKIINKDEIFLENWIWYTYYFTWYLGFPKDVTPNKTDLEYNNISVKNDLLYLSDAWLVFVKDYKKIKLISDNIIYWIPNKNQFLKEVRDDKYHIQNETDNDFIKLKIISKNLTKNAENKQEKIDILYNYILENVSYTQPIDLKNKKIFSWIQTYKNKDGVCEWYVKYFQYLLQFSGIKDVKSLRWYVVDAQDYPQIWHAWTKIGDNYYDPTFDDPIGQTETKKKSDYYYYKLPQDLFYTNRYDYWTTNTTLEKSPLTYREQYIKKNLVDVFTKYKNSDYNILKELNFRNEYWFDMYQDISIDSLKDNFWYIKVNNFKFIEDWINKNIKKYNFFTIKNNEDIRVILRQLNYDLSDHKLLEWKDVDGSIYYRLWFNIQT